MSTFSDRKNHEMQGKVSKMDPDSDTATPGKGYVTENLGIWSVMFLDDGYRGQFHKVFGDIPKSIPAFSHLIRQVFSLYPTLFLMFCATQLWMSCQGAINLHFSSRLLEAIELTLKNNGADPWAVTLPIIGRLLVAVLTGYISWTNERLISRMRRRLICYFELELLKVKLNHSLAESDAPESQINVSANQAWKSFQEIIEFFGGIFDALSQLSLIIHLSRQSGPLFALSCLSKTIYWAFTRRCIWDTPFVALETDKHQTRMTALVALAKDKKDVISYDLKDYIVREYTKASKLIGDASDEHPWILYRQFKTPWNNMALEALLPLPLFYCAFLALRNPSAATLSSIAILQESATSITRTVDFLLGGMEDFRTNLKHLREFNNAVERLAHREALRDHQALLGGRGDSSIEKRRGMEFELRNVAFNYPGAQTNTKALNDVSLTIKSGQFVVLVGANGSGKSTLVKLLAQMYNNDDPSTGFSLSENLEGEILIDSRPASSFSEASLRQAIAVFSQDNGLFAGFSLAENIGLGYNPLIGNHNATMEAARMSGADTAINRMKDGFNTILNPMLNLTSFNVDIENESNALTKFMKNLQRAADVSGGERQRIAAARTFMSFKSGKIRFLAVDEPNSALDAEAEATLLQNLVNEREGKTIVLVTHHFGKLVQNADLIVCMKEGRIVQLGRHEELMRSDGEYKKLYGIQASAFENP
ncbi:hypothetical protein NP233_g9398 [Leucocoprinus birnbaumii]|uniref:ABC transporter domain-containing protein n=1 Tax=Leucocoprinus birnbaumii TaxID=56174 RepID=A0AAD5YN83_9AGAR|nr:hypothetical protein NP233_g9398 [Leucocoprinus birnbaumii]